MHNSKIDLSLYLVTDRDLIKDRNLLICIEQAIAGGVTVVQLREKNLGTKEFYELALQVKVVTDKYQIPLIINDRLDIALAINASGLHVGQDDLPVATARRILGEEKILGVSVFTTDEALNAQLDGADYLGVGAVFPTSTKLDAHNVNLETLRKIKSQVNIPVVAIGGITKSNTHIIMKERVDGIAVVSAILSEEDITKASQDLRNIIGTKKPEQT